VLPELEGMRARADTARAYTVVAEVLAQAGRSDEAIELYRSALERMGDSPFALYAYERFADLLEREGRQAEGFDVLRKALALRTRLAGHEA
jgi:pentatricopeptide repeat protein